jgi:hypothetical protein
LLAFLDVLVNNEATKQKEKDATTIREVATQIRNEKSAHAGKTLHQLEWIAFEWKLDNNYFVDCLKQAIVFDKE